MKRRLGLTSILLIAGVAAGSLQNAMATQDQETKSMVEKALDAPMISIRESAFRFDDQEYRNHSARHAYSVRERRTEGGDAVLRFEVRPGDRAGFDLDTKDRSEATTATRFPKDADIWNAYRLKLSNGFSGPTDAKSWFIVGQWHGDEIDDHRSPYIALELQGDDLVVLRRHLSKGRQSKAHEMYRLKNVERRAWQDIVMQHRVGEKDGLLNVWINGRQVVSFTGAVGYWDYPRAGYFKFGIYRNTGSAPAVAEYSNVVTTVDDLSRRVSAVD